MAAPSRISVDFVAPGALVPAQPVPGTTARLADRRELGRPDLVTLWAASVYAFRAAAVAGWKQGKRRLVSRRRTAG